MNHKVVAPILVLCSCLSIFTLWAASSNVAERLSGQGCRMSWMSPSYILQPAFNTSWTPLASRYSLWLYREVGWQNHELTGLPVLFITGNAGSSQQVRSIASSAARQFWTSPGVVSPEFSRRSLLPLDFFAVEFNEDLSALHGPTLSTQAAYSSSAIAYILSMYPPGTSIIVMGHSMGGVVATSLLPSDKISAVITMSTPHTLPPARFDARIDNIYARNQLLLQSDPTPILSLCGGATDGMIPSESCILPDTDADVYRRTSFTSALEGAWSGVGHREMVWCHQVRWRVARASLELGAASTPGERATILDGWLRDGHTLPPAAVVGERPLVGEEMQLKRSLVLERPTEEKTYLLSTETTSTFVLYVSEGSVSSVGPQKRGPLEVSVHLCKSTSECVSAKPSTLKLVPNPLPDTTFPVPKEGSDESEGVVLYETEVPAGTKVAVRVSHADGRGWVVGAFAESGAVEHSASSFSPFVGTVSVLVPKSSAFRTQVNLPNLLSNVLVVYRLTSKISNASCSTSMLRPLLAHSSHPAETHYFPLSSSRPILLHTHSSAPYVSSGPSTRTRGLDLTIYSSGCNDEIVALDITVDWWATLGRWATRYPTTLASWAIGMVALIVFRSFSEIGRVPTVGQSLEDFGRHVFPKLLLGSVVFALVPLPAEYYLGTRGEIIFSPIAPLLVTTASGLVCIVWWALVAIMWPISRFIGRRREHPGVSRTTLLSMGMILGLISMLVPWQVAFLGCWVVHVLTCATSMEPEPGSSSSPAAIPLIRRRDDVEEEEEEHEVPSSVPRNHQARLEAEDNLNHNHHLLLLMTWLLPIVTSVLVVWVRTLLTAGFTTPFGGDHNFLNVAPFLVLVDFVSWNRGPLFKRPGYECVNVRWAFVVVAGVAFIWGPKAIYKVFDATNVAVAVVVVVRVGARYWGR